MSTITVTMLSDWGVGIGAGRNGLADLDIVRDAGGIPYLPAKTLTGILRDAAERAAAALDGVADPAAQSAAEGPWRAWVCYLFGSQPAIRPGALSTPQPASLGIRPAYLVHPTREQVIDEGLVECLVSERAATAIDHESGTAAENTLRVIERARAGLTLAADLRFATNAQPFEHPAACVLLVLAQRLATTIGGGRRHGFGQCRIEIGDLPNLAQPEWVDRLESLRCEGPGPVPSSPSRKAAAAAGIAATEEHPTLVLKGYLDLTVREPVTVASQVRGNTILTSRCVPGTMLLALALRAVEGNPTDVLRSGRLVVTDANVLIVDGESAVRSVPAPHCMRPEKRGQSALTLHNVLLPSETAPRTAAQARWIARIPGSPDHWSTAPVDVVERAHAVIDDGQQRPTNEAGGLFIQEAITAGTVLRAEVWADPNLPIDWMSMPSTYLIGRSKKDDYGRVDVGFKELDIRTEAGPAVASGGKANVWFQSDTLVRDENGAYSTRPADILDALRNAFGCEELQLDDEHGSSHMLVTRVINSWSVAWGLPRPTFFAVAAGSVVRVTFPEEIPEGTVKALTSAVANGVGDRRAEGFGRIIVNDPLLADEKVELKEPKDPESKSDRPSAEGTERREDPLLDALRRERDLRTVTAAAEAAALTTVALDGKTRGERADIRARLLRDVFPEPDPDDLTAVMTCPHWADRDPSWVHEYRREARRAFWLAAIARASSALGTVEREVSR